MSVRSFLTLASIGLLSCAAAYGVRYVLDDVQPQLAYEPGDFMDALPANTRPRETLSGDFLSARFAQSMHDWDKARDYLDSLLSRDKGNTELLKKSLVLAIGAGRMDEAAAIARQLDGAADDNGLPRLVLAIDSLRKEEYAAALQQLDGIPDGSVAEFVVPVMRGWASAGLGTLDIEALKQNPLHSFHAVLIADYLDRLDSIRDFIDMAVQKSMMNLEELERVADIYARLGKTDKAEMLYSALQIQMPENEDLTRKLKALQKGEKIEDPLQAMNIKKPAEGAGHALYDMANLLFQKDSDDSAQVFAQLALYLDPALTDARILLAGIAANYDRYDEALSQYDAVGNTDEAYVQTRQQAAELLVNAGRTDEALVILDKLFTENGNVDALIQIGDIRRRAGDYEQAIRAYNRAAATFGKTVPEEYWHLLYARGMAYERDGQWQKAEADLLAALGYRPDHPYLLNYLGYGWADQGVNLEKSLDMIRKAAELRPADGYITDSYGWVLYRLGRYEEAIAPLEHAVELMPYDSVINDHLGDAYWQAGRRLEARFQWRRALNSAEDKTAKDALQQKLHSGLTAPTPVRAAGRQDAADAARAE